MCPRNWLRRSVYRPGQFCTFRFRIDGDEVVRSYSMSSAPETDDDLAVTVKRVDGGLVSNWMLDHLGRRGRSRAHQAGRRLLPSGTS